MTSPDRADPSSSVASAENVAIDLDSLNGSYVNGLGVGLIVLGDGDQLQVGELKRPCFDPDGWRG